MGNKATRDGADFPAARVDAVCADVFSTFTVLYEKAVGVELCRGERQGEEDRGDVPASGWVAPPVPEKPLQRGWMMKLGDKSRSWKRRYVSMCEGARAC